MVLSRSMMPVPVTPPLAGIQPLRLAEVIADRVLPPLGVQLKFATLFAVVSTSNTTPLTVAAPPPLILWV
ncbi:MAG: hypothetical protein H7A50_09435 [Akkermansiaceae bacterium]|nr:hypothetical protein [Akkermansiaceae bacterium]